MVRRVVAQICIVSMANHLYWTVPAHADNFTDSVTAGQSLGSTFTDVDSLHSTGQSQLNSMFGASQDTSSLQNLYNTPDDIEGQTSTHSGSLSTGNDGSSQAYQIGWEAANRTAGSHADTGDGAVGQISVSSSASGLDGFTGCTKTVSTDTSTTTTTKQVDEEEVCTITVHPTGECTRTRNKIWVASWDGYPVLEASDSGCEEWIEDEAFTATSATCTDYRECRVIDDVLQICDGTGEAGLVPDLVAGGLVAKTCYAATVKYELTATMQSAFEEVDTCKVLKANYPDAQLISQECNEEAHGLCYSTDYTYKISTDYTVPSTTTTTTTTYDCGGVLVRCMGSECAKVTSDTDDSASRAEAIVALTVMQNAKYDKASGKVFSGNVEICHVAFGGESSTIGVDCCFRPEPINMGTYIHALYVMYDLGSKLGAWDYLMNTTPVEFLISLKVKFLEMFGVEGGDLGLMSLSQIKELIQTQLYNFAGQTMEAILGPEIARQVFAYDAVSQTYTSFAGNFATAFQVVCWAYTIYSVTKLIIQIVYCCDEDDVQLASHRAMKLCTKGRSYCAEKFLGICLVRKKSFCCFNTPLARIVHEQARPQIGKSWGSAKSPDCSGFTAEELSSIDWNQVDLTEWFAYTYQAATNYGDKMHGWTPTSNDQTTIQDRTQTSIGNKYNSKTE